MCVWFSIFPFNANHYKWETVTTDICGYTVVGNLQSCGRLKNKYYITQKFELGSLDSLLSRLKNHCTIKHQFCSILTQPMYYDWAILCCKLVLSCHMWLSYISDSVRTTGCLIWHYMHTTALNPLVCHTRFVPFLHSCPSSSSLHRPPTLTSSLGEGICINPSVRLQHMARGGRYGLNKFLISCHI